MHKKEVCQHGYVHSNCRCALTHDKMVLQIECDNPSHKPQERTLGEREFDVRLYAEPGRTFPIDAFKEMEGKNRMFLGWSANVKSVQREVGGQSVLFVLRVPQ